MLERYFYNSTSGRCEVFYYGGCSGNENKFMSIEECNQRCNPLGKSACIRSYIAALNFKGCY